MATATLTTKGQLTLPKEIRDQFNLKAGDKVDFIVKSDSTVVMKPINTDVRQLFGSLAHLYKGPPVSVKEMDEGIARHMREKFPPPKKASRK